MNKALKLSCTKGLPVRVVRSFKASLLAGGGMSRLAGAGSAGWLGSDEQAGWGNVRCTRPTTQPLSRLLLL